MKGIQALLSVASLVFVGGGMAVGDDAKPGGITALTESGPVTYGRAVKIKTTVEEIDLAAREVTLKGPKGRSMTLRVEERVRNLPEVRVGDEVIVRYNESVSLELRKAQAGDPVAIDEMATRSAQPSQKLAAAAARQRTVVADVEAVSPREKTVTLKGPKGNFVDLYVRDPTVLASVAVGDKVIATYTEAAVVLIEQPRVKKKK